MGDVMTKKELVAQLKYMEDKYVRAAYEIFLYERNGSALYYGIIETSPSEPIREVYFIETGYGILELGELFDGCILESSHLFQGLSYEEYLKMVSIDEKNVVRVA